MIATRVHTLELGAYSPDEDFDRQAGAIVDAAVAALLPPHERGAVRALSIYDHPGKTCGELARIIASTGTDRYDPRRRPVLDDFYGPWGVDLHAITCWIGADGALTSHHYPDLPVVAGLMRDLRQGPPVDRDGVPLRVDLVTLYDREALQPVEVVYADGVEDDPTAFRLATQVSISEAVLAVFTLAYGPQQDLSGAGVSL